MYLNLANADIQWYGPSAAESGVTDTTHPKWRGQLVARLTCALNSWAPPHTSTLHLMSGMEGCSRGGVLREARMCLWTKIVPSGQAHYNRPSRGDDDCFLVLKVFKFIMWNDLNLTAKLQEWFEELLYSLPCSPAVSIGHIFFVTCIIQRFLSEPSESKLQI